MSEKMWRWAYVREDVKMSRCERRCERICERRCEDEQMWEKMLEKMWRWANVKMSRCEDEQMWEKMWEKIWWRKWADERRCERRCERRYEDEQMWRWADVREDVKMSRCEDEQMWRWEGVKMRRWDTDPHYWKNPALRRSREKCSKPPAIYIYTHRFSMGNALNISPAWTVESCWDHTLLDHGGCRDKTQKSILTGTIEWGCLKFGGRPYS